MPSEEEKSVSHLPQTREAGIVRTFALFFLYAFSGPIASYALAKAGASESTKQFFESKPYAPLIFVIVYYSNRGIFSRKFWKFPRNAWYGALLLGAIQLTFRALIHLEPDSQYRIFAALFIAPILEELLRAGMICSILAKSNASLAIVVTSILVASFHELFWFHLLTQILLCLIFVRTNRSLPACILAHFVGNLVAVIPSM